MNVAHFVLFGASLWLMRRPRGTELGQVSSGAHPRFEGPR
jgi:hypothetical protein